MVLTLGSEADQAIIHQWNSLKEKNDNVASLVRQYFEGLIGAVMGSKLQVLMHGRSVPSSTQLNVQPGPNTLTLCLSANAPTCLMHQGCT